MTKKVNTCPTLILDKKNNIITIYSKLKDKDSCNGVCTKLEAKKVKADNKNQVSLVVDSGIIKLEDIDLYFRLLKDGTKQWSVNGINYTSVDDSIESIYLSKNILYIPHEGKILGLSLSVLEYCGIPMKKVLGRLKSNGINIIEDDKKFIFKLSKQLGNKKYAIPYFVSS